MFYKSVIIIWYKELRYIIKNKYLQNKNLKEWKEMFSNNKYLAKHSSEIRFF